MGRKTKGDTAPQPPNALLPTQWTPEDWQRIRERPLHIEHAFFKAAQRHAAGGARPPKLKVGDVVAVWMGGGYADVGPPIGRVQTVFWTGTVMEKVGKGRARRYIVRWRMLGCDDVLNLPPRAYLNKDSHHAWFAGKAVLECPPERTLPPAMTINGNGHPMDGADDDTSSTDSESASSLVSDATTASSAASSAGWRDEPEHTAPVVIDPDLNCDRSRAREMFRRSWADDGVNALLNAISERTVDRTPAQYEPPRPGVSVAWEATVFARRLTRYFRKLKSVIFLRVFKHGRSLDLLATSKSVPWIDPCLSAAYRDVCRGYVRLSRRCTRRAVRRIHWDLLCKFLVEMGQAAGIPERLMSLSKYRAKLSDFRKGGRRGGAVAPPRARKPDSNA